MATEDTTDSFTNIEYINQLLKSEETPIPTCVKIDLTTEAVSLQSSRAKKEKIKSLIRSFTEKADFVLTGNVTVSIVWHLSNQEHYESDSPPDVDNIVKPILDAMCGKDGIMVDDCQVTSIDCSWIDWDRNDQQVSIEVEFSDDLHVDPKKSIVFIQFEKALCFKTFISPSPVDTLRLLKTLEAMFRVYLHTREKEGNYYAGIYSKPAQRFFHVSRLQGREFPVYKIEDIQAELESKITEEERKEIEQYVRKIYNPETIEDES